MRSIKKLSPQALNDTQCRWRMSSSAVGVVFAFAKSKGVFIKPKEKFIKPNGNFIKPKGNFVKSKDISTKSPKKLK